MDKKDTFSKILTICGTSIVLIPIIIQPVLYPKSLGEALFHYFLSMEFIGIVLAGGLLLFWAALRTKQCRGMIGWSLLVEVILLPTWLFVISFAGLVFTINENHDGSILSTGLIIISALYILAVVLTGIGGIRLLRKLYNPSP